MSHTCIGFLMSKRMLVRCSYVVGDGTFFIISVCMGVYILLCLNVLVSRGGLYKL